MYNTTLQNLERFELEFLSSMQGLSLIKVFTRLAWRDAQNITNTDF